MTLQIGQRVKASNTVGSRFANREGVVFSMAMRHDGGGVTGLVIVDFGDGKETFHESRLTPVK